jgi:hypothetical protein
MNEIEAPPRHKLEIYTKEPRVTLGKASYDFMITLAKWIGFWSAFFLIVGIAFSSLDLVYFAIHDWLDYNL